jgi:hypothetical protein
VLRVCRRLLRRSGRLAFLTIHEADGLSRADRREAAAAGPPAVLARDHHRLLRVAGFGDVVQTDLTAEYRRCARRWCEEAVARGPALRAALGDPVFEERQRDRELHLDAIERGLLRRSLFVAVV